MAICGGRMGCGMLRTDAPGRPALVQRPNTLLKVLKTLRATPGHRWVLAPLYWY